MNLTEAITHCIAGDEIGAGIGRDEKGLYVEWDSIVITMGSGVVKLFLGTAEVGQAAMFSRPLDMETGGMLQISGLEGRVRVKVD